MKATEGKIGRVFILRFDDGDIIPETIEKFASDSGIAAAYVAFSGGLADGEVTAGTDTPSARPCKPCLMTINEARSAAAAGLLVSDVNGTPRLQLYGALGYQDKSLAGGLRPGLKTWLGGEAVIYEIVGACCHRDTDDAAGYVILNTAAPTAAAKPRPELTDAAVIHAGDHTHLLYAFNAEFN